MCVTLLQGMLKTLAAYEDKPEHFYQTSKQVHKPFTVTLLSPAWSWGTGQTGPSSLHLS